MTQISNVLQYIKGKSPMKGHWCGLELAVSLQIKLGIFPPWREEEAEGWKVGQDPPKWARLQVLGGAWTRWEET